MGENLIFLDDTPMPKSHLSYAFLAGFIGGITLLRFWEKAEYPMWIWMMLFLIFVLGLMIKNRGYLVAAAAVGIALAIFRIGETTHVTTPLTIDSQDGKTIEALATVAASPERRLGGTRYKLKVENFEGLVRTDDSWTTPRFREGDTVKVKGVIKVPEPFEDVDFARILRVKGVYAILEHPRLELKQAAQHTSLLGSLGVLRIQLEERISKLFPEPEAALLTGLLTGSDGRIPPELSDAFSETGLTHLLAISGFNIMLVLSLVQGSLVFLPRKFRLIPAGIAVCAFTLFVGASASAVRACIMGCLGLVAAQSGRLPTTRLMILWAMAGMLFYKPQSLWDDAGFQLSFLAVIGLSEFGDVFAKVMKQVPEKFGLREQLHATLTAQLLTTPWIAYAFQQVSLIAPLANIIAGPAVPIAMLFGAITVGLDLLGLHTIVSILQPIASLPLRWLTGVPTVLSVVPFASIEVTRNVGLIFCISVIIFLSTKNRAPIPTCPTEARRRRRES